MTEQTDTGPLRQELERVAATGNDKTIFDLVARSRPEIEKVLPPSIGVERFERVMRTEVRRNPKLGECDPTSFLGALMLAAQLGLEPGPLGQVYLVPFKRQVEFIVGYRGYIDLAYRSGQLKRIEAHVVREGDEFEYRYGSRAFLDQLPQGEPGTRAWVAVYALAELRSGGKPFIVLYPEDVEKRRKRSAAANTASGPWVTDTEAMWRKSAIRALTPILPLSAVVAQAIERDEAPAPEPVELAEGEGPL